MIYSRNQIPRGATWTGFGVSRHSFPMAAQAILLGGHIRVGFEDTIYLRKGELAENNATLVHRGAEIVRYLGADVASVGEARKFLGLRS